MALKKLIKDKILYFAQKPENNPNSFNFPFYTLSFIEDDYPAKTPVMWNAIYQEFNFLVANIMLVGHTDDVCNILNELGKDKKYLGGGMGVGFKDEAVKFLKDLDSLAEIIGSINLIQKTENGILKGHNTDGEGYALSLEKIFKQRKESLVGKKVLMLGAGGTGNAIAFSLARRDMKIIILNRTINKAEILSKKINQYFKNNQSFFGGEDEITDYIKQGVDVIVNVSIKGATGPLEKYSALAQSQLPTTEENINVNIEASKKILADISKDVIISDIVLRSELSPLLKLAQKAGLNILTGIPMVINQAVKAFEIIHSKELRAKKIKIDDIAMAMKEAVKL